jgi:elongation factor Ts
MDFLREKGLARANKKLGAGRTMNEGVIAVYQHFNKRVAAMVEVNCETDFVAKTDRFQEFAYDVAMHVANLKPEYIKREDVPAEVVDHERQVQKNRVIEEGKPEHVAEKIVEGRMGKFYEEIVLMEQAFLKDDSKTIEQLLKETVAEVGESIEISNMSRFAIGEGEDEEENGDA